jgi:predicted lipoprotein with Yx(FWY)xxD motif
VATSPLGPILVDAKGFTLYAFTKDTQGSASTCSGGCSGTWPALLAKTAPVAGSGVDATKLSVIARADGTPQAAYNGWPLYYFAKDAKAGDTTGDKVGGVWFVVDATGTMVRA